MSQAFVALTRKRWSALAASAVRFLLVVSLGMGMYGHAWESQKLLAAAQRIGPVTTARAQALIQEIAEAASQDEISRLRRLNTFFNRQIEYREDKEVWGMVDYWATPLEMMNKGAGDCEDYAIAKYFSLIASGVSAAKMRLFTCVRKWAAPSWRTWFWPITPILRPNR